MSVRRRFSSFLRSLKNKKFDDVEVMVRDATSNDDAGAPDQLIWHIIHASSQGSNMFARIAAMLWKRILDLDHPRHVYKGLNLLFHLLQHGTNKESWRENALGHLNELRDLKQYNCYKNAGTLVNSIRRAAGTVEDMTLHPERIDQMKAAHKAKKKSRQRAASSPRSDSTPEHAAVSSPRRAESNRAASPAASSLPSSPRFMEANEEATSLGPALMNSTSREEKIPRSPRTPTRKTRSSKKEHIITQEETGRAAATADKNERKEKPIGATGTERSKKEPIEEEFDAFMAAFKREPEGFLALGGDAEPVHHPISDAEFEIATRL